jgi:hypothetical protein
MPHAIRDNAQDDGTPIPLDLVASFQDTYDTHHPRTRGSCRII